MMRQLLPCQPAIGFTQMTNYAKGSEAVTKNDQIITINIHRFW